MTSTGTIVQFTPFSSLIQPAFWHELTRLKLDVLKLSADEVPIVASYAPGRSVMDRETGNEVDLGCHLVIGSDAFEAEGAEKHTTKQGEVRLKGILKNFNTLEEFKAADKTALLNRAADEIWYSITHSDATLDPTSLTPFLLITFADLKKYRYYYWLGVPALVSKPAWSLVSPSFISTSDSEITGLSHRFLATIHEQLHSGGSSTSAAPPPFFLLRPSANDVTQAELAPLSAFPQFWASTQPKDRIMGFVDPSAAGTSPGWPLRNALAYLRYKWATLGGDEAKSGGLVVRVLCWRDGEPRVPEEGHWKSRFGIVEIPAATVTGATATQGIVDAGERPGAVGWEKNTAGKMGPRMADLAPMMDPTRLASQAVDLNLKLMRWRILPALDLETIADTKCLLLGAGTLGCYVARGLMAWGVRTITFVDSATVSFSNPVRQPLFEFTDCLGGGKPKAACAADALKKVFPGVNATGIQLSVPMPGHPIPPSSVDSVKKDIETLEKLVSEHDAVFLLMDSRESRWLPTVLGKAKGKIVMNAALGFDSYLVMRHGARVPENDKESARLGCYYCNDVVAPADSLSDRTLDQMCTVTRPGLAALASATAVELLVSVLQHPAGVRAPAPPPSYDPARSSSEDNETDDKTKSFKCVLGIVPHQLRCFLGQFRTLPVVGAAYDRCTGCSETVLREYEGKGHEMLLRAFNETGYLEKLTGLDKLQSESEAAMESMEDVDWDEEDDM